MNAKAPPERAEGGHNAVLEEARMKITPPRNPIFEGTIRPGQVPVAIKGVWLRREGNAAVVLIERDGKWHEIIREALDAQFSHICEPSGIRKVAP